MNIDLLNIFLLFISLGLAIVLPIDLLIFSYAFIGPFHYLTEINWLENKQFFIKGKKWAWVLTLMTFLIILSPTIKEFVNHGMLNKDGIQNILTFLDNNFEVILFFGLILSIVLVYTNRTSLIILVFTLTAVLTYVLYDPIKPFKSLEEIPTFFFVFGVFLPTIIHVYLFTALFMLYGALKSKSTIGIISVLILISIPFFIYNLQLTPYEYLVSDYSNHAIRDSNFAGLNQYFSYFLSIDLLPENSIILPETTSLVNGQTISSSPIHLKTQIFIAFAYIYHYLNWFSKTTVINWHKSISKQRIVVIVSLYLLAIGIYMYNFKIGFIAMFFLSFLHVLLEFPLNVVSVKGIIEEVGKKLSFSK